MTFKDFSKSAGLSMDFESYITRPRASDYFGIESILQVGNVMFYLGVYRDPSKVQNTAYYYFEGSGYIIK